uniref:Uncharacterized protein n=1 Tax=Timema genevievae TaxID=629358 RepID=A0A7R9PH03_TIMGE|nr:unnamed protein product [Timema genevievae]
MSHGVQNRELVSTPAQVSNGRSTVIGHVLFSTWMSVTGDYVQLITVDLCPVSVTLQNRLFLCNGTATSRLTNVDHHRCKANDFPQAAIPWHKCTWNLLSSNRKTCSIQSQTIEDFGAALHLMRSDLEHLRSVFMAVENGDLGMLKSLGIKDSELGDVKFFLEKLVNTGFLD